MITGARSSLASVESSDQLTGRDDGLTACKSVTGGKGITVRQPGQAASAQSQDRGQDKLKMLGQARIISTLWNKSEIVTAAGRTDFHFATFPPMSIRREKLSRVTTA